MSPDPFDEVCGRCGLTFGAHRADSIVHDQCPAHQGWMDWPIVDVGTFVPTGEFRDVPYGTASRIGIEV